MPIDARIPLMGEPPPQFDMMGTLGRIAQVKRMHAVTENEQQELVLRQQEAARDQEREAKRQQVASVLGKYGADFDKALPEIFAIDPEIGMRIQTTSNSAKESSFRLKNAKLSHDKAVAEEVGRKVQEVKDADGWGYFLADLKASGLPTEGMPTTYDPATVESLKTKSLTVLENATLQERELAAEFARWRAAQEVGSRNERDTETRRHNRVMEQKPTGSESALVAIVGPNGKPVLVPRSQAVGQTPASTRESGGGRGVTSGDANRVADLDTSLDDVAVLRTTISGNKSTGTRAAIGAALPNFVTEATGWGQSAKEKQAVIDRVKQVIGKALEGGVLRKEDELKYTKILPVISDTPETVAAKLNGLDTALRLRRSTLLDSLDDAGYNVDAYTSRVRPKAGTTTPGAGKVGRFTVVEEDR